jgi:hypothetical protein
VDYRTEAERLAAIEAIVTRIEANQTKELEAIRKRVRNLELAWATASGAVMAGWLWVKHHVANGSR